MMTFYESIKFGLPWFNVAGPCSVRAHGQRQGQDDKKPPGRPHHQARGSGKGSGSGLFNRDGAFRANFHAAFAPEAFFGIHRHRLAVLHLKDLNRANIHALLAACALFFVDSGVKSHQQISFQLWYLSWRPAAIQSHFRRVHILIKKASQALLSFFKKDPDAAP
jgi:hypothetical protein